MFDWDAANVTHIAQHGVKPDEAEEAYNSYPVYLDYQIVDGEERHREVGETSAGRILVIVSTMRGALVRIVTAYSAERPLRLTYLAFKESEQHGKADHS